LLGKAETDFNNLAGPLMVTLLFTSVFVLGLLVIAVYFWQKSNVTAQNMELPLPPPRPPAGLFSDYQPAPQLPEATEPPRAALLELASNGDKNALDKAHALDDRALYDEVLNTLAAQVDSAAMLLSLVSYVTRNELPINKALAQKSIDYWKGSLDRNSTAKLLHVAALSDDAQTYCQAVEVVLGAWRDGKLQEVSADELLSLFNGEFWVLSSNARSSGAGFVLKRTLSSAKRELELTNNLI
jgi:hypothetical protein